MREAGILMPITSLNSKYGIGCFSESAYEFVDFLADANQKYWQILPLGPTGYGDSPYQAFSTYAGNPYSISLEELIKEEVLTKEDCDRIDFGDNDEYIDYEKIYNGRFGLLKKAFHNSELKNDSNYHDFLKENNHWIDDYALFMAIKDSKDGVSWFEWEEEIRLRKPECVEKYKRELSEEIEFYKYVQYKFYEQWIKLKKYANSKGIKIIGDIPIYVSPDSSDVWANPELFQLDVDLYPTHVAGCPPDGFSWEGQLWGNPLYDWKTHKLTDYKWWIERIKHCFGIYDWLRIDHFRGFDEFYSIKYGSPNAVDGKWEKGPGAELFRKIEEKLGKQNVIAEDLGFITDSVKEMLKETGYPGMKVLEFAFDARDTGAANDYLPHNYTQNCVVYTGTHDNQTLSSWFMTISDEERKCVRNYICDEYTPDNKIYKSLVSLALMSSAKLCIIPIQDYLGLEDWARINTPSTLGDNWKWRITDKYLTEDLKNQIKSMTKRYGR